MKSKLTKILGVLLVALFAACVFAPAAIIPIGICAVAVSGVGLAAAKGYVYLARRGHPTAINTLSAMIGSSKHSRRYRASGAIATRFLFVKAGADDEHIAAITATADKPIGVCTDEAAAAEDPVNVELSGINGRTLPCVAGAAIATLNVNVYTDTAGKVVGKPTSAGTYWKVGRNLTLATAADDPVEVQLCEPRKLIVIAALGNTNGEVAALTSSATTTQAEFNALRDKIEEGFDDMRAIAAALDGDADVALATT